MPLDPHALHIYTDGSCLKNPGGRGGAAAFVEYPDHISREPEQIVNFGCAETSNNRMELIAVIKAIEWLRKHGPWPRVGRAVIVSDSTYVRDNLQRANGWQRNGWRNLHGEEKQNSDLWKELLAIRVKAGLRVDFQWQPGKSSPILKAVDKAAKNAAKGAGLGRDMGFKTGKVSRSQLKQSATIFPAKGQLGVIRIYRKSSPRTDNQIRFHLLNEADKTPIGSHYAYASDALTLDLHRQHSYRVRFNDNPKRPVIEEIIEEIMPKPVFQKKELDCGLEFRQPDSR